jgi:hypothetical protein
MVGEECKDFQWQKQHSCRANNTLTRVLEQIEEWISAKFLTLARLGHSLHGRTSITAVI